MKRSTEQSRRKPGLRACILAAMMTAGLIGWLTVPLQASTPDLTGTYTADDGGVYYVQQSGNAISWAGMSVDSSLSPDKVWHRGLGFTNVFHGTVNADNTITGDWADVTRGATLSTGTLKLAIGSFNGAIQLTKLQATGGFGATTWTQSDPVDDTRFEGLTLDLESRFFFTDKNDGTTLLNPNLKPYRDQTVFYGRVINSHIEYLDSNMPVESEIPHVNYDPPFNPPIPHYPDFGGIDRTYSEFFVANASDADFDMRLKVDMDRLEPDFYTTGWGGRTYGPEVYNLKLNDSSTHEKLKFGGGDAYMGLETIMFGRNQPTGAILLPGWSEMDGNSVLINGRPMNGPVLSPNPPPSCDFVQPCPNLGGETLQQLQDNYLVAPAGIALGNLLLSAYGNGMLDSNFIAGSGIGTYLRVTGALILDCGHGFTHDCFDNGGDNPDDDSSNVSTHQNQEIHPVYSVDVINYPFRPEDLGVTARMNLTGTWGGSDGSTYYVRQIGNTIWWLGMMRDRQPIQPGTRFPIIGANQLAPAFAAGDPPCSSSPVQCWAFANVFKGTISVSPNQTLIDGDWMGVPQSTSAGSSGGHMQFYLTENKIIVPATSSIFPVIIEKMYEPGDTTAPQSSLTVGAPQYVNGNRQLFVTGATSFTVTATDQDSGPQNIWYRDFLQGTAAPQYTPVVGSTASFKLAGTDGTYEVDTYATDNAGNDETLHSTSAYLDTTAPVATFTQPAATLYGHGDTLTLDYSVSDGTGSGVKNSTPRMDGQTAAQFGASLDPQRMIYLESMSLGQHTFSVQSVDNLNNDATNSVTFTITVTPDSLIRDVNNLVVLGCLDNIGQSLIAKISSAKNLIDKGQIHAAINTLAALINEVQTQAGKHISISCHDPNGRLFTPVQLLLGDAQYLQGILAGQL